ncbi:MAG: hypothetical protein AAFR17_06055 [Pseudomonadota bacterium]
MKTLSFLGGVASGCIVCVLGLFLSTAQTPTLPALDLGIDLPEMPDMPEVDLSGSGEMPGIERPVEEKPAGPTEPKVLRKGTASRLTGAEADEPSRKAIPGFARGNTDAMRVTVNRAQQTEQGVLVTLVFHSDTSGMTQEDFSDLRLFFSHRMCTHKLSMRLFQQSGKGSIEVRDPSGAELHRFPIRTLIC